MINKPLVVKNIGNEIHIEKFAVLIIYHVCYNYLLFIPDHV